MSRKAKIPIQVPKEIKVAIEPSQVRMEGPKGKVSVNLPYGIAIEQKDATLIVKRKGDTKQDRSNHGSIRAHLVNMIVGVTQGHKKELEIQGVGFRAQTQGNKLILNLGFSHPVEYDIPADIKVAAPKQTNISIEGTDKALVGQVAAQIRDIKPPEPYKGKGIRYQNEVVRRKQGKTVTK